MLCHWWWRSSSSWRPGRLQESYMRLGWNNESETFYKKAKLHAGWIIMVYILMLTLFLVVRFSSTIINCVRLYWLSAMIILVISAALSPGHSTGSCFLSTFLLCLFPPFQRARLRPALMTTMSPPSGVNLASAVETRRNATRETSTF